MGPNSNQLQLQLQLRVRLATADCECGCGCDCCNAHACNQCCKHLFLWLQERGRAQQQQQSSQPACCQLASNFVAQPKFVACLNIVLLASCLVPRCCSLSLRLCLCCWSQLSFPCCPCTFCNQMRLTPTIVFGFSCCNIAAFYRCGKLTNWQPATSNCKLETGNWQVQL